MTRGLAVALVLASPPVAADEGELAVTAAAVIELATIEHPLAAEGTTAFELAPFSIVPHAAVSARFGLTNELQLGLGLNAGASANVQSGNVLLGGTDARLVTGTYVELGAPVTVTWRVNSGYDLSGAATIEVGPMVALWLGTAAIDPVKLDADALPQRLPLEVSDAVTPGLAARLLVAVDARFIDYLVLRVSAYAGVAWAASPFLIVGVALEPSWIVTP